MKTLEEIIRGPIHLAPNRVWRMYAGGGMLGRFQGDPNAVDTEFPEEWVGSTVQASNPGPHYREGEGLALIAEGLPDPVSLKSLLERFPEALLGPDHVRAFGSNAALLAKLLDAAVRLIIHAHPTKEFALRHLGSCFGKTEAWFVFGTRPEVEDPYVLIAFKEEVSRERYRTMLDRQDIDAMIRVMHRVPVRPGDVVYVRAGLPHAIGEGVLLVELQEPTDYSIILERICATYTFREDESFLGLDPSLVLSVLNHRVYTSDEIRRELVIHPRVIRREGESTETELLGYDTTECFAGRRLDILGEYSDTTGGRYALLIVLRGSGVLAHAGGEIPLHQGIELFLPACAGSHIFRSAGGMSVFKCLPARIP
jgi:mannose-6-phosphate isomerase